MKDKNAKRKPKVDTEKLLVVDKDGKYQKPAAAPVLDQAAGEARAAA